MAQVAATAAEQFFMELMNRARLDPTAEAALHGIGLNSGLAAGTLNTSQRQVLAINPFINQAADGHSNWLRSSGNFDHTGNGGTNAQARMVAEGYNFTGAWSWGENLAWIGSSGAINVEDVILSMHHGLFLSVGHRQNTMNNSFREAGVGLSDIGPYLGYANGLVTTQNFALSGSKVYVTGVNYTDTDGDKFYSIGEGVGSRTVQLYQNGVANLSTASTAAGGYSVATSGTGTIEARFSGGGLTAPMGASFSMGGQNVKIDLVNGSTILSSHSATLTGAALNLTLLGINANSATGNALDNILTGNDANNSLCGGLGNDTIYGDGGDDTLIGGGHDVGGWNTLVGGAGFDTADYSAETGIVYADLSLSVGYINNGAGFVFNDALQQFENLIGGAGNDALSGDDTANLINGRGGNDVMFGKGGDDTMIGGGHLVGGYDVLYGDAGIDTMSFAEVSSQVYADLLIGSPYGVGYVNTGAGFVHDSLFFAFENIIGGAGNDILQGDNNANTLTGGDGADFMLGQGGNDTLIGGIGNDSLYGGAGNDRFVFDQGLDIATGGADADTFYWNSMIQGADVVSDFSHAEGDKINLDHAVFGVPTAWGLILGANFFVGAGAAPTQATASISFDTTSNILWYDIDGTGVSGRQAITFLSNGGGGITAGDILFV